MIDVGEFTAAAYGRHLAERKVMGSRCDECGELHLPPRPICSGCRSRSMSWAELSGKGRVIGITSVAIAPSAMVERGFGRDKPYATAIVALDDGPSVAARIEGVDATELPGSVPVGMAVVADFLEETVDEEKCATLVFRPA